MKSTDQLISDARSVLKANDQGSFTIPAHGIYPHQWLWDSCFIAIGQRHYDVDRAKAELVSTLRGQWRNGMIPHMILMHHKKPTKHEYIWQSDHSPFSPNLVGTSGITQPPILAEAVWQVGQKLTKTEQRTFYNRMLPAIINYHQWLYNERDPNNEGLVVIIHPWESGMDNSPALMQSLKTHHHPLWIKIVDFLQLEHLAQLTRLDYKRKFRLVERAKTIDELHLFSLQRLIDSQQYESKRVLQRPHFAVQDVGFNSILIRSNQRIIEMANAIDYTLSKNLVTQMHLTAKSLHSLQDPETGHYFSRDYITKKLIRVPTIASMLPLYSGCLNSEQASQQLKLLQNKNTFWTDYPIPTVSASSPYYESQRYWQGATWVNANWLIIEGLKQHGFIKEAKDLSKTTLSLISNGGSREYFDSLSGKPLGAENFSWTAALTLDLLNQTPDQKPIQNQT